MVENRPVFEQINVVVGDMTAMVAFYERLGVQFDSMPPPWDRHHNRFADDSVVAGLDFDLDSQTFAAKWNGGWPRGQTGPVLTFRLASADAVDATYDDLTGAGYAGQQPPYDAFWGARYAVVADPDGNAVALMGPTDPAKEFAPPDPEG